MAASQNRLIATFLSMKLSTGLRSTDLSSASISQAKEKPLPSTLPIFPNQARRHLGQVTSGLVVQENTSVDWKSWGLLEIRADARIAVQEGKIYGFFYIPKGLSAEAQSQRQPKISFYTNYSYLIAGSLLFRDMKMMGELTAGSAARSVLYAKGATEDQAMGFLQPIVIDTHPLNNPWLNYSVYLCNTLIPGVLMLLIFMVTVYSIGVEIKDRTAREWLRMSNNSIYIALAGKLLPHTVVFFIMGIFYNVYLYGFLHFPCNSGIFPMIFATLCLVLASQCCGIVMIGTLPTLRLGLSFASLWGVISFSISGFSFPVMAMNPVLQALSNLFPLRHYFLIYVDQALNGYSMAYSWSNYMALLIFMMLPFFVVHRLKEALVYYKYIP